VADQDAEAVGVVLDVAEQCHRRRLELLPGVSTAENRRRHGEKPFHLAIHHDRVQAFLAAEVLVDHWLGDAGLRSNLLNKYAFETPLREEPAAYIEQLLPAFLASHSLAVVVASARIAHPPIIAVMPRFGHLTWPRQTKSSSPTRH